ncbi:MAG: LysE family transporter [Planctomycetota bacterium]
MQPGPVTATVITLGSRNRNAGALLAIGHGIIEFPLMIVIILGMARWFQIENVQIAIGLIGGLCLLLMAMQMVLSIKSNSETQSKALRARPVLAGVILSASNPYFLIWWATIGLALAIEASQWGPWAFVIFAFVHWSVDLIWLELLSLASFKGSSVMGEKGQQVVLLICAAAMTVFGVLFIVSAAGKLF